MAMYCEIADQLFPESNDMRKLQNPKDGYSLHRDVLKSTSCSPKTLQSTQACFLLFCGILFFLSGCGGPGKMVGIEVEEPVDQVEPQVIAPSPVRPPEERVVPVLPVEIYAVKRKKVVEFVEIDGERYQVPSPWRGKKIKGIIPGMDDLAQIPVEFTWQETRLYIHHEARDAFVAMAQDARNDGIHLQAHSGFRSIRYQKKLFSKGMAKGRTWEDMVRYVAPPGYSEHMLGIAVDLYPSDWRFAGTAAYGWLKEHGAAYGFVESYPEKSSEGLPWEAWHWRYCASVSKRAGDS